MNEIAVKRTLAAIVMADVVGYSRLMGEDEAGTLKRLTQYRSEFIDPTIAAHRGRIVNAIGDSLLLEFGSVVDATVCAIALQQAISDSNAPLSEPQRIAFRMGVNIGDVIVQNRSLFGDSVNVAARLQALAEPGGICLSGAAYEQIRGKIEADFADIGAHQVKNIARPVVAFALSARAIEEIPRLSPPKAKAPGGARSWLVISAGALCLLAALALGASYLLRRGATTDFAAQLDSVLSQTQAKLTERSRAKLVSDFLAIGRHRAFAIAPKAQAHWWTGDWTTAASAEQKALERCQIAFNEPCETVAVDDAMTARAGADAHLAHDMEKVRYAGDFDSATTTTQEGGRRSRSNTGREKTGRQARRRIGLSPGVRSEGGRDPPAGDPDRRDGRDVATPRRIASSETLQRRRLQEGGRRSLLSLRRRQQSRIAPATDGADRQALKMHGRRRASRPGPSSKFMVDDYGVSR